MDTADPGKNLPLSNIFDGLISSDPSDEILTENKITDHLIKARHELS